MRLLTLFTVVCLCSSPALRQLGNQFTGNSQAQNLPSENKDGGQGSSLRTPARISRALRSYCLPQRISFLSRVRDTFDQLLASASFSEPD
jgi:hypothetical protein